MHRVKMKFRIRFRPFLCLLALCFMALFASACTFLPYQENTSGKAPDSFSPFIWKTTINDSTFYLVGSVHFGKKEYYPLPDQYMHCYERSDAVIMEVEDDLRKMRKKVLAYAEKIQLPKGQCFRNHLDSHTTDKILKIISGREFRKYDCYNAAMLRLILQGRKMKQLGFDTSFGVDMFFQRRALKDKKQITGLEDLEDQLSLFYSDEPIEAQVNIIKQYVDAIEAQAQAEGRMVEAYFSRDAQVFEKAFLSMYDPENSDIKISYDLAFTKRNQKWVEKLEEISLKGEKTYMVIAGAGHFFGPNNIRFLLDKKGYKVVSFAKDTVENL